MLIDDCSTDTSYQKLLKYATDYDNIRVFKNECNKGVSYTRNRLIEEALGEFIWFVDPDDMIVPDTAALFYNTAVKEGVPCVYGNYVNVLEDNHVIKTIKNSLDYRVIYNDNLTLKDGYKTINAQNLQTDTGLVVVWQGLISKEYLVRNGVRFYEELFLAEDLLFHYDILLTLEKFVKFDAVCYNYRIRENSAISSGTNPKKLIKSYVNSYFLYVKFNEYLREGKYNGKNNVTSKDWLLYMAYISAIDVLKTIVKIKDNQYFKQQYSKLKSEKLFEYVRKNKHMIASSSIKKRLSIWLLTRPLLLKFVRLLYKIVR